MLHNHSNGIGTTQTIINTLPNWDTIINCKIYCKTEIKLWPFSMSLYIWSIKESNCSFCWTGSWIASQAWTHWLKELNGEKQSTKKDNYYWAQDERNWRTEVMGVYLVPIPCPLVPTRANRERKPSGVNHCNTISLLINTEDPIISFDPFHTKRVEVGVSCRSLKDFTSLSS